MYLVKYEFIGVIVIMFVGVMVDVVELKKSEKDEICKNFDYLVLKIGAFLISFVNIMDKLMSIIIKIFTSSNQFSSPHTSHSLIIIHFYQIKTYTKGSRKKKKRAKR